jgi:hypothetical protein
LFIISSNQKITKTNDNKRLVSLYAKQRSSSWHGHQTQHSGAPPDSWKPQPIVLKKQLHNIVVYEK